MTDEGVAIADAELKISIRLMNLQPGVFSFRRWKKYYAIVLSEFPHSLPARMEADFALLRVTNVGNDARRGWGRRTLDVMSSRSEFDDVSDTEFGDYLTSWLSKLRFMQLDVGTLQPIVEFLGQFLAGSKRWSTEMKKFDSSLRETHLHLSIKLALVLTSETDSNRDQEAAAAIAGARAIWFVRNDIFDLVDYEKTRRKMLAEIEAADGRDSEGDVDHGIRLIWGIEMMMFARTVLSIALGFLRIESGIGPRCRRELLIFLNELNNLLVQAKDSLKAITVWDETVEDARQSVKSASAAIKDLI